MMKKNRDILKINKLNNQGFSFIELLVSIVILVIIMVPLMNNFFGSMKLNKEAEAMQKRSNVATNIMEGLKSLTMEETLHQFDVTDTDTDIFRIIMEENGLPIPESKIMRLIKNVGVYEEHPTYVYDKLDTYYFAINGLKEGGTSYDALITMDAQAYQNSTNILNDYSMPDIINLNDKMNGLLISNIWYDNNTGEMKDSDTTPIASLLTLDEVALEDFIDIGEAYAYQVWMATEYTNYLSEYATWEVKCQNDRIANPAAVLDPAPTGFSIASYPNYCDASTLTSKITKTMKIIVDDYIDGSDTYSKISYQIDYQCGWTESDIENTITYKIADTKYETSLENIYLFHEPSLYQVLSTPDKILIVNNSRDILDPLKARPINLFIAGQGSGLDRNIRIIRTSDDGFTVFTDFTDGYVKQEIDGMETINNDNLKKQIINANKKHRLYAVTIQICAYVDGGPMDKYKKILFTLQGTRQE